MMVIETTSEWDGQYSLGNFRPGQVLGQTFASPEVRSQLESLSFWLTPYAGMSEYPPSFTFDVTAYVAPWDGEKATEPFVAQSTTTITAMPWTMNRLDFNFTGANLWPDEQYVMFLVPSSGPDLAYANFGYVPGNPYASGRYLSPYMGSLRYVSSRAWSGPSSGDDVAFEMRLNLVPEPSTYVFALVAGLCLLVFAIVRRRRHAAAT